MKKLLFILVLCGFLAPLPARADPVTMAMLAPLALKAAREASPYIISGMRGSGSHMMAVAEDFGQLLRLPWGVVQATAGLPFGYMGEGFSNIFAGVCAPFGLIYDLVTLPFTFTDSSGI